MRGEYTTIRGCTGSKLELPPRTRRIPAVANMPNKVFGTTSAYAENTRHHRGERVVGWNYLRVRGEYEDYLATPRGLVELPPRTRRIPVAPLMMVCKPGTTSAYAENTWWGLSARK